MVGELLLLFLLLFDYHLWLFAKHIIYPEWLNCVQHISVVNTLAICWHGADNRFLDEICQICAWKFLCLLCDKLYVYFFLFSHFLREFLQDVFPVSFVWHWDLQFEFDSTGSEDSFVNDVGPVSRCDNKNHVAIVNSIQLIE